jgi:hypothetical protein
VPLLCISPYAYAGQVNHTTLEMASIPKYVETLFGLPALAAADKRATPADSGCTNPQQTTPRPFTHIRTDLAPDYFLHERERPGVRPDPD